MDVRKRTRLSKAGNARLRKALDLPALAATRFNPLVAAFDDRLVEAGKPKMAAVGAGLRKLVTIAYGVLKSRTPFDPTRGSKITPRQHTIWSGCCPDVDLGEAEEASRFDPPIASKFAERSRRGWRSDRRAAGTRPGW